MERFLGFLNFFSDDFADDLDLLFMNTESLNRKRIEIVLNSWRVVRKASLMGNTVRQSNNSRRGRCGSLSSIMEW